jgi:hypothetical protein
MSEKNDPGATSSLNTSRLDTRKLKVNRYKSTQTLSFLPPRKGALLRTRNPLTCPEAIVAIFYHESADCKYLALPSVLEFFSCLFFQLQVLPSQGAGDISNVRNTDIRGWRVGVRDLI